MKIALVIYCTALPLAVCLMLTTWGKPRSTRGVVARRLPLLMLLWPLFAAWALVVSPAIGLVVTLIDGVLSSVKKFAKDCRANVASLLEVTGDSWCMVVHGRNRPEERRAAWIKKMHSNLPGRF